MLADIGGPSGMSCEASLLAKSSWHTPVVCRAPVFKSPRAKQNLVFLQRKQPVKMRYPFSQILVLLASLYKNLYAGALTAPAPQLK
jgi:hypothetical protein